MKKTLFVAVLSLLAIGFTACKDKNAPENNTNNQEVVDDQNKDNDLKPGELPEAKTEEAKVVKELFEQEIVGKPLEEVRSMLAKLGFVAEDQEKVVARKAHKVREKVVHWEYYYKIVGEEQDFEKANMVLSLILNLDKDYNLIGFDLRYIFNVIPQNLKAIFQDVQATVEAVAYNPDMFLAFADYRSMTEAEREKDCFQYSERQLKLLAEAYAKGQIDSVEYYGMLDDLAAAMTMETFKGIVDKHFGESGMVQADFYTITGSMEDKLGYLVGYQVYIPESGQGDFAEITLTYLEGTCYEAILFDPAEFEE